MLAQVEAETEAARAAIVDNLPALRDRLQEQGVRIERFEVGLMHRHSGGSPNQSDQRQANESQAAARVALPARRVSEASTDASLARPVAANSGRLNVIV
jgi:flagellar hook-length control protein FliK